MVCNIMASEKLDVWTVASIGSAGRHLVSQSGNTYEPRNLIDGDLGTTWALPHNSGNVMLQFGLKGTDVLNKITIHNGYAKSERRYKDNSRAKKIGIYINGIKKEYLFGTVTLDDSMQPQEIDLGKVKDVQVVYIRVLSVYPGEKWSDLCISEVSFRGIPAKNDADPDDDMEAGYTVVVPARKLALNEKQIETMSRSRYIVLTTEQKQSLSPVWDVDTLSLLPSNWYECSCGIFKIEWTDIDSVFIPETRMPAQAPILYNSVDISYGPWITESTWIDGSRVVVGRTFMGLDGQLYQMGKAVAIEDLIKKQRKNQRLIEYKPDLDCTNKALSIAFPPTNVMDERITEMHKEKLVEKGLKFCEMYTPIEEIMIPRTH